MPGAPLILALGPISTVLKEHLRDYRPVHVNATGYWSADLARIAPQVRAIVAGGAQSLPTAWLDNFPGLELVAVHGVGVDGIDMAAARARGIAVANTPDVLTDDVAELAIGLLLAVARRIVANDRFVRSGRWERGDTPGLGVRLAGRHVGLVGLGRIGEAIAYRLQPFGVELSYTARGRKPICPYRWYSSVYELAQAVDVLIIAVSGGQEARGLVDVSVLDALGPTGILVNVARGSVVDEAALLAALTGSRIAGAGLDVFGDEPGSASSFAGLENVVLQPHQGSASVEARLAMARIVVANLDLWFNERTLLSPVAAEHSLVI